MWRLTRSWQAFSPRGSFAAALGALALACALAGCGGGGSAVVIVPTPLGIFTPALADGTVGVAYSFSLVAVGGTPPYHWSITTGNLPAGLTLDASTGRISGTPTNIETKTFTIMLADSASQTQTMQYTVSIGAGVPLVERMSVAFDGSQANGDSGGPAVSPDGRFIAFTSFATNLIPTNPNGGDTNFLPDIFVRDRTCNTTVRANIPNPADQATLGREAKSSDPLIPGLSLAPAISGVVNNVLFVAYASDADNLVLNDTNRNRDIFVTALDISGCPPVVISTTRASVATDPDPSDPMVNGAPADLFAALPILSDPMVQGSDIVITVAYHSPSTTLAGGAGGLVNIFATELKLSGGALVPLRTRWLSNSKARVARRLAVSLADTTADIFSSTTIGRSSLTMTTDEHKNRLVVIVSGTGAGQSRTVTANTATTLTVGAAWTTTPDNTSVFRVTTPNATADIFSATTIGNSALTMTANEHVGRAVQITAGTGFGQSRTVTANTATTLTVGAAWTTTPDNTSVFRVTTDADFTPDPNFITSTTTGHPDLAMTTNEQVNNALGIVSGTGDALSRHIASNDATSLTLNPAWPMNVPDGTSVLRVVVPGNGNSFRARITADGSLVAFHSTSSFDTGNTAGIENVFLHEHTTGSTAQVDVATDGEPITSGINDVSAISPQGRFVLFQSTATCVLVALPSTTADSFSSTTIGNTTLAMTPDEHVGRHVEIISGTGFGQTRTVTANNATTLTVDAAWTTTPTNTSIFHVCSDTNGLGDLFVRDRTGGVTTRVSLANDGSQADAPSDVVAGISGGGRLVAFATSAANLDPAAPDTNALRDIYLRDRDTDSNQVFDEPASTSTRRLSRGMGGVNPNTECFEPVISRDGTVVVFTSEATNLVPNDTNGVTDIFLAQTGVSDSMLFIAPRLGATRVGALYSGSLLAVGGSAPYYWAVVEGSLPPGLSLDPRTGVVSGVPQREGQFLFTVMVMDGRRPARQATRALGLTVGR